MSRVHKSQASWLIASLFMCHVVQIGRILKARIRIRVMQPKDRWDTITILNDLSCIERTQMFLFLPILFRGQHGISFPTFEITIYSLRISIKSEIAQSNALFLVLTNLVSRSNTSNEVSKPRRKLLTTLSTPLLQ